MTPEGIVLTDLICVVFAAGILSLLRRNRLFLEFALLWFAVLASIVIVVSVPGVLPTLNRWKGYFFLSPLYIVGSLFFVLIFLVYITITISHMRRQLSQIARHIALADRDPEAPSHPASLNEKPL